MRLYPLSCLLIASLILFSCKKDNSRQKPFGTGLAPLSLIGQWQWIEVTDAAAVGGTPYDSTTAKETGTSKLLNMNGDSTWSLVVNGQTINNGTFFIDTVLTPDGPRPLLAFNSQYSQDSLVNHTLINDSLYTSNVLFEGKYTVNIYIRASSSN